MSQKCPIRIIGADAECPIRIVFCPISIVISTHFTCNFATDLAMRGKVGSKFSLHPFAKVLTEQKKCCPMNGTGRVAAVVFSCTDICCLCMIGHLAYDVID